MSQHSIIKLLFADVFKAAQERSLLVLLRTGNLLEAETKSMRGF
jgi:hypothetical protein